MITGIYKIRNVINNDFYIGSSINIDSRWNVHRHLLKNNKHYNLHLQRAWNKYNEKNFVFEIIEEVLDKSKLVEREQHYLDSLNPSYNECKIAGNTLGADFYKSEEHRNKISKATMMAMSRPEIKEKLKMPKSEEAKQKMSLAKKGKETWSKGKIFSKEHRENISKSRIQKKIAKGKNNPMYGRRKESSPHFGKPKSEEHRKKISDALKRFHRTGDNR